MRLGMPAAVESVRPEGSARRLMAQPRRGGAAAAVAFRAFGLVALLVAVALGGGAGAADGSANAAASGDGRTPVPARVGTATAAVTPMPPLTVIGTGAEALTCVQSPVALDAAGRAGVLAPQVGVTVIRGSAPPSPSVNWVVVPAGRLGDGGTAITVCVPTR